MSRWLTADQVADHVARMRGLEQPQTSAEIVDTSDVPDVVPRATRPHSVTLVLPMPPTLNHAYTPNGRGGKILTDEYRNFRDIVRFQVMKIRSPKLQGRLKAMVLLYPADNRRWDIDNRSKCLLDALQYAELFDNDEQIDHLEMARVRGTKRGECVVTITEI